MAYIQPNNKILLLHNVPIDKEYVNTMWWIDQATQYNTMSGFVKYTCAPTTYQRVNRNTCRVEHNADTLFDVNYMMFQNTNFGNKWFYAFVEKIDYINDAVSEITYRIDEIQSWYFDFTPLYSYVERCHSATDTIGDNLVEENLGCGEYVTTGEDKVDELVPLCAIILTIVEPSGIVQGADVQVMDKTLSGCTGRAFKYDTEARRQAINAYLTQFVAQPDQVVAIYIAPEFMVTGTTGSIPVDGLPLGNFNSSAWVLQNILPITAGSTSLDGYVPKNNKMYTYPYNFITISNNSGDSVSYRYEFFANQTPRFDIDFCTSLPVSCKLYPLYYKGSHSGGTSPVPYVFETLTLDNFPMCSWNSDYFKGWLVQNSVPMAANLASSMYNYNAMTGLRGEGSYARMSPANQVASILGGMWQASLHADILKGGYSNGNINISHDKQTYYYAIVHVNHEYAELIDGYFSRYGYAQMKVMLPPRHNRTQFTYVKTIDCKISGSIPCDSEDIICNAFNKGITFWTNIQNVGNYLVNNGLLT